MFNVVMSIEVDSPPGFVITLVTMNNSICVQLLFISGSSSPGAVFFSYWIWAQGQRLVEWG
jgi:hypothetical protein